MTSRLEQLLGSLIGSERSSGYCAGTSSLAKGTNMAEVRGKTGEKQSILNRYFQNMWAVCFISMLSIGSIMVFAVYIVCFV